LGSSAAKPCSYRWRRQLLSCEAHSPSRRRTAENCEHSVHASTSPRLLRFCSAANSRLWRLSRCGSGMISSRSAMVSEGIDIAASLIIVSLPNKYFTPCAVSHHLGTEGEAQRTRDGQHPLAHWLHANDVVDQQRCARSHTPPPTAPTRPLLLATDGNHAHGIATFTTETALEAAALEAILKHQLDSRLGAGRYFGSTPSTLRANGKTTTRRRRATSDVLAKVNPFSALPQISESNLERSAVVWR
jgi:hypothetical protein